MVTQVGTRFNVSQAYSRNVEHADTQHAQRRGGQNLRGAPNQNVAAGTRGKFKSSTSYFRDSLKGFFQSPMGKKIAFLKDRVELRSVQKREFSHQQRCDREDRAKAGKNFSAPAYNNPLACEVLTAKSDGTIAGLRITLGEWASKASQDAKSNATSVSSEREKIANHLMTSLTIESWKDIDKPALKRLEDELRGQGRHDQADMLGAINSKLAITMTQSNAVARFHGVARTYIRDFNQPTVEFWRNNNRGGELELKALVNHGFMNPFKAAVFEKFEPALQSDEYKQLKSSPEISPAMQDESHASKVRVLAEKLFDALETVTITEEMRNTLAMVRDDIDQLRPDEDKDAIMQKFFVNSIFLSP